MQLTEEQRVNLTNFLRTKKNIIGFGELRDGHFTKLDELGFGNGGVVLKVEHNPSGVVMARKVCVCVCMRACVYLRVCVRVHVHCMRTSRESWNGQVNLSCTR